MAEKARHRFRRERKPTMAAAAPPAYASERMANAAIRWVSQKKTTIVKVTMISVINEKTTPAAAIKSASNSRNRSSLASSRNNSRRVTAVSRNV